MLFAFSCGLPFRTRLRSYPHFRDNTRRYCTYPDSGLLNDQGPYESTESFIGVLRMGRIMRIKVDDEILQARYFASCSMNNSE